MDITEQLTHESRIALAAAAEITRLRAEVESEKATSKILLDSYADENGRISAERDALKAEVEVEALRADAERYRWLREQHWFDSPICVVVNPKMQLLLGTHCPFGEKLDEKIDAARAAQGE